jgi:hypothetical protein
MLKPLYFTPGVFHDSLVLRLPDGRLLSLMLIDGAGYLRSVGVWRWEGRALGAVNAGSA